MKYSYLFLTSSLCLDVNDFQTRLIWLENHNIPFYWVKKNNNNLIYIKKKDRIKARGMTNFYNGCVKYIGKKLGYYKNEKIYKNKKEAYKKEK